LRPEARARYPAAIMTTLTSEPSDRGALLAAGAVLGERYRVRRVLAVGGMGVVYQVVSLADHQPFAIKALLPALEADRALVQRFHREAATMRLFDHPHLVRVIETFVADDRLYLVMELVAGPTLDRLASGRPLAPSRAIALTVQILDALGHAHRAGVIHRDLKPENVVVTARPSAAGEVDHVKVLDFGVAMVVDEAARQIGGARLTQAGFTQGTPEYMAPEQAVRGTPVDHRADLYAAGVILFELLTGTRPFDDADRLALMHKQVYEPPPRLADVAAGRPWATPALESVVATALAKLPDERFASAAGMRAALLEAAATLSDLS